MTSTKVNVSFVNTQAGYELCNFEFEPAELACIHIGDTVVLTNIIDHGDRHECIVLDKVHFLLEHRATIKFHPR